MNSIALALGGGAARSYSSIGVMRVIEENDININAISGTSMGALIGSLIANGYTSYEIETIIKNVNIINLLRFNIFNMANGLFNLKKLKKLLQNHLPESFCELKYPLYVTAVDIDSGELVVMHNGKLIDALIASCSVPVLFNPVVINGKRFVDGGLKSQIPWQILAEEGYDNIVCVSNGYIAKKKPIYKGLTNIAIRAIDLLGLNMNENAVNNKELIVIQPDVTQQSVAAFNNIDRMISEGINAARLALMRL